MAGVIEADAFGDAFHVLVTDSTPHLVNLRDNACKDFQSSLRLSRRSSVACILYGDEGCAAPGTCYLGEEPVFYWVVFRAIGWIVHHYYAYPELFGKIHKVLLHYVMPAGVGSAAVTEDDKLFGAPVHFGEVFVPESLHVVADELGGVVAESDGHESDVVRHVVDAVRHNHAVGERGEIMVKTLWGAGTIHLPVSLEVANRFLLLGVYADYRYSEPDAEFLDVLDLDELLVPALHAFQRDVLTERPFLEATHFYKPSDMVIGDVHSSLVQLFPYPVCVDVQPDNVLVHRVSRHVVGDDLDERSHPFGMSRYLVLRTAARHALSAIWGYNTVEIFGNCLGNGVRGTLKNLAYSPSGTTVGAHRLACNKMPSVAFFKCFNELHFHFVNLYWRLLFHFCNILEFSYKDTKISPVIYCSKC